MRPDRNCRPCSRAVSSNNRAGRPVSALLSFSHRSQRHALDLRPRHYLVAALLLGCLLVEIGRPQYVEDSVDVGGRWVGSLAYNPLANVVYGASEDGPFFALSCSTNSVVASFSLGHAYVVCYDSQDNKAYCTFTGSSADSLAVIDGQTHSRIKALPMSGSSVPVWDAVSNRVYVSCQTTNRVAVVDCATDSLLTYIPVGACPLKLYLNTLRRKLYVLNYDAGSVSVVDLTTNQVIRTVVVGGANPNAGYYCRSVDKFYSDGSLGHVVAIDGRTDSIVASIPVAAYGNILSATGNEQAALVMVGVYTGNRYVYTIDAASDSVTAFHQVDGEPFGLLYSGTTDRFYCGNGLFGSVTVITGDGANVVETLLLGDDPFVLLGVPRHNRIYVGDLGRHWVYVIRDSVTGVAGNADTRVRPPSAIATTPSPFRRDVRVTWNRAEPGSGRVRVLSRAGGLVRTAKQPESESGQSCFVWDGRDDHGRAVPAGVYFVDVGAGIRAEVVKLK